MGLFKAKDPCPLCGGKVPRVFAWKIQGTPICNSCHGLVDLPDGVEDSMTLDDFAAYMAFRDENDRLRDVFQTQNKVDFGWLGAKFLFDFDNCLACFDKKLGATIFEGSQIASFSICEDDSPLVEGSPEGIKRYESSVPDQVAAMAPQIESYRLQRDMQRELERNLDKQRQYMESQMGNGRDGNGAPPPPPSPHLGPSVDLPEPFGCFNVEIRFDHPYWQTHIASMSAPTFDNDYPSVEDYLREYQNDVATMENLAASIMEISFPEAPVINVPLDRSVAGPGAGTDPVSELRRYKELLDEGIISSEEFTAKKRQLLGI